MKEKIFIVGASSKLSMAIADRYSGHEIVKVYRDTYNQWIGESCQESMDDFFKERISLDANIVFIAAAILNPNRPKHEITRINYELPLNIINSLKKYKVHCVTFGTILEKLGDSQNPYVSSKIKLATRIETLVKNQFKITHFRLHTLYGRGLPSDFMFLGQLYQAIKLKTEFQMSSGEQIREYHHYDDIAEVVYKLLSREFAGIFEMTYGNGTRLKDLATELFDFFGRRELLKIGSRKMGKTEKFQNDYVKNAHLHDIVFREPINGVKKYLEEIL